MKLTILTTITNPEERQDRYKEALSCYQDLADEVIVVSGSHAEPFEFEDDERKVYDDGKTKFYNLPWPYDWNWIELPRHLNFGLQRCSGDWILKLDIDQLIHENDFIELLRKINECPDTCDGITLQKMTMFFGNKYFQKGEQAILFRNKEDIRFGEQLMHKTDLCFPVKVTDKRIVDDYELPRGIPINTYRSGISYFNYDYYFKTMEFTKKEFWRFSQAYYRFFREWTFGGTPEDAFQVFLNMTRGRQKRAPYTATLDTHPKWIRSEVAALKKEQYGYDGWEGLV